MATGPLYPLLFLAMSSLFGIGRGQRDASIWTTWAEQSQQERNPEFWFRQVPSNDQVRLKGNFAGVYPLSYSVNLRAPIQGGDSSNTFEGTSKMEFYTVKSAPFVAVHVKELDVRTNGIRIRDEQKKMDVPLAGIQLRLQRQILLLIPVKPLRKFTRYQLFVPQFSGTIRGGYAMGIFQSFVHQTGNKYITSIGTQFQLNYARTVFPCIDLPHFKANLSLTLLHPTDTKALGNMQVGSTGSNKEVGWTETRFLTTPRLPTYTMGFVILPTVYSTLYAQSNKGVQLVLHYSPFHVRLTLARTLLNYARYCMNRMELQLTRLPLGKIDLVMLEQFAVQGMENYGLITLNQNYMLTTQPAYRLSLLAHEITHQWISNLVTVDGWDHICVQEGLTDHFARNIVKEYFNGKSGWDSYYLDKYITTMKQETKHSPPKTLILSSDPTISEVSSRCFGKGVFIFDGLEKMVGSGVFLQRVQSFLIRKRDQTFRLVDLTNEFRSASVDGQSSGDYLAYWFTHGGYPSVFVSRTPATSTIHVEQQHIYIKSPRNPSQYQTLNNVWPIPFEAQLRTSKWTSPVRFFNRTRTAISDLPIRESDWFLLNPEFAFFFRVNYDHNNWDRLVRQMVSDPTVFSATTRAQLVNDFCFFYKLGLVPNGRNLRYNIINAVYSNIRHFKFYSHYVARCI